MGLLDNQTPMTYYNGNNHGDYQFVSLQDIINQFMFVYVGEDKIISKASRVDVAFHAQRALAELSFDTLKSCKAQEITLPPSLQMTLPQDYVNYTKVSWVDNNGIKHPLYPTNRTSNPQSIVQDDNGAYNLVIEGTLNTTTTIVLDGEYESVLVGMEVASTSIVPGSLISTVSTVGGITTITIDNATTSSLTEDITFTNTDGSLILKSESTAWSKYKSAGIDTSGHHDHHDHHNHDHDHTFNSRYGLDPQHAQANGSFYIDCQSGKIHFSSNISGKTVILDYISDSLGTDSEMQVHKFAEEAMYKCIAHAVLSGKSNIPEYQVNRFKKERFAAVRTAKLRLSSLKLEELTQILRGKSKQIKH